MKFTVNQSELKKALYTVSPALPNKTTMPVLHMICMITVGNLLTIKATNLEMTIVATLHANVEKQGVILVEGKLLNDLVGNLPNQTIEISIDKKNQLNVHCGNSKSELYMQNFEDYPDIPNVCVQNNFLAEFNPVNFKQNLQQVVIAAANTDSRPILAGVHFLFDAKDENTYQITATDGFRLSQKTGKYNQFSGSTESQFVIPINLIENVLKFLHQGIEKVEVFVTESAIGFKLVSIENETLIMGRKVFGTFPAIANFIPKTMTTNAIVSKVELQKALRVVKLFATKSNNIVSLTIQNGSLSLSAQGDGKGENVTEISADVSGEIISLSLNVLFLEDLTNIISSEKIVIRTVDVSKPITFKEHHENDDSFVHVIMPMIKK
jgi:DNA polymerase-3 subunit beta